MSYIHYTVLSNTFHPIVVTIINSINNIPGQVGSHDLMVTCKLSDSVVISSQQDIVFLTDQTYAVYIPCEYVRSISTNCLMLPYLGIP